MLSQKTKDTLLGPLNANNPVKRQWALCRRHPLALAALAVYLLQLAPHQQYPYFGLHQAMRLREFMGL